MPKLEFDKTVSVADLCFPVRLLVQGAIAWFVPERLWPSVARPFALMKRILRRPPPTEDTSLSKRHDVATQLRRYAMGFEHNLQLLKCYRPGGWSPNIQLNGLEHLERSLAKGTGTILWMGNFSSYSLAGKMAFDRAGYEVAHLSEPYHGFSFTRVGVYLLNPLAWRVEDRYIAERVFISDFEPAQLREELTRRLGDNRIVSITAAEGTSRAPARITILGEEVNLAVGALALAYRTGATVLPVFPIQLGPGHFAVTVCAELARAGAASKEDFVRTALDRYRELLEDCVRDHPEQWLA